jgi:hypothetical protein
MPVRNIMMDHSKGSIDTAFYPRILPSCHHDHHRVARRLGSSSGSDDDPNLNPPGGGSGLTQA